MKLLFTGDFYPSKKIINNYLLEQFILDKDLIKLFKKSDYSFLNLESPIITNTNNFNKKLKLADNLSLPEISIDILKDLNISHACLANNHIMDYGLDGLNNTTKILNKKNINYLGIVKENFYKESNPIIIKNKDIKIAIFNTAEGEEGSIRFNKYGVLFNDNVDIFNKIKDYKKEGFFIIMIVHAGAEHIEAPPPHIVDLYRKYCSFGCDIVVGHHPHLPQGYEDFCKSKIFYSLGNFLMYKDCWKIQSKVGQVLTIDINNNSFSTNLNYIEINENYLKLYDKRFCDKMNKILLKKFNNRNKIWDKHVNQKYNPVNLFFKSDLLFFNFSRTLLRFFNILCTPSHQFGFYRWFILNKKDIIKSNESNLIKFIKLFKRALIKIKRILIKR